ncbi:MAG: VWA domain-containing protein [Dehalococcoidia bacterium]|nr:VWA domain-containing protein [Dehalococcoidia bacterium]
MGTRFRYSIWDGTQTTSDIDAEDLLDSLSDDLLNFGDLQHAMRNLMQRGARDLNGDQGQGLRDLLQQLRQQRREQLDRFDLASIFDDLQEQLDEILSLEHTTLDNRLEDATKESQPQENNSQNHENKQLDETGSESQEPEQEGSKDQPQNAEGNENSSDQQEFSELLKTITERKKEQLRDLPEDTAGQIQGLQNYEFMDKDAEQKFRELVDSLKQAMMDTFFKDLSKQISDMSPEDMDRAKEMASDLNEMLKQKMQGQEPDFDNFMDKHGDMFGDNPPDSLEELLAQMQAQMGAMQGLMNSLPQNMQDQLQQLISNKIGDPELANTLSELAENMMQFMPPNGQNSRYPFRGDEDLDLSAAMELMKHMQEIDELERQIERTQFGGDLDDIDMDKLEDLLGEEAKETIEQLKQMLEILEDAGFVRRNGDDDWELTPRGTRKIGQRALVELYSQLKNDSLGKHEMHETGQGGERTDDTKPYEFGDPFHLDIRKTIMNSVYRNGPGLPADLKPQDFEVARSEKITQTATVIMLDLSWSMALKGNFQAAKKVALALNNLISAQFQRDSLYIIGFSAYARELKATELPFVHWDESVLGTNMHHGLMIAEKLLAKHTQGTRQVIMISDGEPTAHLENGRSYFAYPPSPITIRETLREVQRCTKKGITINTFMLERSHYLKEFVNKVAKINKGRVFYTTPDKLGEYILVDYVAQKQQKLAGRT